jgi:type III polyketide synthase
VPSLTSSSLAPAFKSLCDSCPEISSTSAPDFDWALHPGGATILTGAQNALNLTEEHLRCSYEVYVEHGNSSSATILSVLSKERTRGQDAKKDIVAAAFGPGVTLEIMLLRRGARGSQAGETNGHGSTNGAGGVTNGHDGTNGHNGTNGFDNAADNGSNGVHTNGHGHMNGANGMNGQMAGNGLHAADGPEPVEIGDISLPTEQLD